MKLLELEINNIRGIKSLKIEPNGNNFVIWGPNGSGKSAVIDAIDFLLTGQISRLTGSGTGGITLNRYGPHIDCDSSDAWVQGIIQLPTLEEPIVIKRSMNSPTVLEFDENYRAQIALMLSIAQRGQHILTRRDILRFIASERSTRAKEIQELLNISEIERIRGTLVRVKNTLERDCETAKQIVDTAKARINSITQLDNYQALRVLTFINENRKILEGQPIETLHSSNLKADISQPIIISMANSINFTLLERHIQNLTRLTTTEYKSDISGSEKELRELIEATRKDTTLLRNLSCLDLITLGLKLLDETGNCPLCDTHWPIGTLKEHLEMRLKSAKEAAQLKSRIDALSSKLVDRVNNARASIEDLLKITELLHLSGVTSLLQSWQLKLNELLSFLAAPIERFMQIPYTPEEIRNMFFPEKGVETFSILLERGKSEFPEITPKQKAWDILTRLEENLAALETSNQNFEQSQLFCKRANLFLENFIEARDDILRSLYDTIENRFAEFYRYLHGIDESEFVANLEARGAGLNFEVDFYGRGSHPPLALHSEGHQDSMGICLWLALSEHLTQGIIELIILDDVVMSVDSDHRRFTCDLLASKFPNRQFLITTHDRTWVNQLKYGGVVDSKSIIEFYNWHIDTGPQVNIESDMWNKIEADLQRNDVPSAAAKLRRGSETFFRAVCNALEAEVVFRDNSRWDLGDFLPAAMKQYSRLIRMAKTAAQSWGNKEAFELLNEQDSVRSQIFSRTQAEQWAVNASVHYNNWANFTVSDFRPVLEAFQDLYGLFVCRNCGGLLHLTLSGTTFASLRCPCGTIEWTLTRAK